MLLHKHYGKDLEVVNALPLFFVCKMIIKAAKKDTEVAMYPLWLAHVVVASMKNEPIIPIEDMLKSEPTKLRSKEEIEKDFLAIIEKNRKGVSNG